MFAKGKPYNLNALQFTYVSLFFHFSVVCMWNVKLDAVGFPYQNKPNSDGNDNLTTKLRRYVSKFQIENVLNYVCTNTSWILIIIAYKSDAINGIVNEGYEKFEKENCKIETHRTTK